MLKIIRSKRFEKDIKLARKRKLDLTELNAVIMTLARGEKLAEKYKDHALSNNFKDFRECHIKPDWILIYAIDNKELELFLFRTGTHSDLFK